MEQVKISKRFLAYFLDVMFVYLLISMIISIRVINPTYEKYQDQLEKYQTVLKEYEEEKITVDEFLDYNIDNVYYLTKYSVSTNVVIIVVLIGYFVFFQKYNNGQTLGKKVARIKVAGIDKKEGSLLSYFLRLMPQYFMLVGNVLTCLILSILVFILKQEAFYYAYMIAEYLLIFVSITSLVMIGVSKNRRGIHEIVSKTCVVSE